MWILMTRRMPSIGTRGYIPEMENVRLLIPSVVYIVVIFTPPTVPSGLQMYMR